jgi:prepilin-type processing-associated H-X9-DG protein
VQPYVKSYQVYACPSDADRACFSKPDYAPILEYVKWPGAKASMTPAQLAQLFPLSYAANFYLSQTTFNKKAGSGTLSLGAIQSPAKVFLLSEYGKGTAPWSENPYGTYYMIPGYNAGKPDARWNATKRHMKGRNWTFCDGHAKYVPDVTDALDDTAVYEAYRSRGVEVDPYAP